MTGRVSFLIVPLICIGCEQQQENRSTQANAHSSANHDAMASATASGSVAREQGSPLEALRVRVSVTDETQRNPLHDRAEVWMRGLGSWWLSHAAEFGGDVRTTEVPDGRGEVIVYPDSREGAEIQFSFAIDKSMNPGSVRDMISITIYDNRVTAFGTPIRAATGDLDVARRRPSGNDDAIRKSSSAAARRREEIVRRREDQKLRPQTQRGESPIAGTIGTAV